MRISIASSEIVGLSICLSAGSVAAQTLPLAEPLISLNGEQGSRLLLESEDNRAYWPLSIQFVTQKNQAFCGGEPRDGPQRTGGSCSRDAGFEPYKTFTQDNLLNEKTEAVLPVAVLSKIGMTLDQIGGILGTYAVKADVRHAADSRLRSSGRWRGKLSARPTNMSS